MSLLSCHRKLGMGRRDPAWEMVTAPFPCSLLYIPGRSLSALQVNKEHTFG